MDHNNLGNEKRGEEKKMSKVLIYKGKYDDEVYDVSTEEREQAVYISIFKQLNNDGAYAELIEMESALYTRCKQGDLLSLRRLFQARRHYEYEFVEVKELK